MVKTIEPDAYRKEVCSITREDCACGDCRTCETARAESKAIITEEQRQEREEYTNFDKVGTMFELLVGRNSSNIIARTDMVVVRVLQEKGVISKNKVPYHPNNIYQYYHQLLKLRKYNNLGIPDDIWASPNLPAAFRYDKVVYLIAPKVVMEKEMI